MLETKRTKEQLRERELRIIEHARQGRTMTEIVDIEGLDAGNVKHWHRIIRDAGVTIEKSRASKPPIGLKKENERFRFNLGRSLVRIRDVHPQVDVSRMVGMTGTQCLEATEKKTHDWTVSQIQRLAEAQGMSFQEMVINAFTEVPKRKYSE